jgi:integrase/recombinase XerD
VTEAIRTELPPDARQAVEAFLESLAGRNASPGTITEYRRHTTEFLVFLAGRGVDWTRPDRSTIRAYLSDLADRELAASSVAGRLAAVRSLYRHALRNGLIETDPLAGVRAPRRPSRLPRVLSVDEAASLVTAPRRLRSRDEALARRDASMLELLYATGMRISELAGLTLDRLDLDRRRLRVVGKGNKERELLFGAPAAGALRGYLAEGRPVLAGRGGAGNAAVYLNASGAPLSARGARLVLERWVRAAGAPKRTSPHTLRHSFATHLLDGGADVRVVQELLGHASVTTTQVYTLVTVDKLREVYATSHPRALSS